jgi:hypothetical protein
MFKEAGKWEERRSEKVHHSMFLAGNVVLVEGSVIEVSSNALYRLMDEDSPEHKLRFETRREYDGPVDTERVQKMAVYAAHVLRLLRDADDGDEWSLAKLGAIATEEPPYLAEHRKANAELDAQLALRHPLVNDD